MTLSLDFLILGFGAFADREKGMVGKRGGREGRGNEWDGGGARWIGEDTEKGRLSTRNRSRSERELIGASLVE